MSDSIFRFYSYNENHLHSLSSAYLWFSNLEDFNDPFEACFHEGVFSLKANEIDDETFILATKSILGNQGVDKVAIEEELIKLKCEGNYEKFKQEQIDNSSRFIKQSIESLKRDKYCCFLRSSKNTPAETNKQMWSYYSDGLRGFMIEFDFKELKDGMIKSNCCEVLWTAMHYGPFQPEVFKDFYVAYADKSNVEKHEVLRKFIFRKDTHWEYENEIRFQIDDKPNNKFKFVPKAIKKIVIGEKMSNEKRMTLLAVLKSIRIDISKQLYVCKINDKTLCLETISYYDFIGVNKEGRDE